MARHATVLAVGSSGVVKVALVCPYAWDRYGGVQTHVRSLAHALRAGRHEVCVIAPTAGDRPPETGVFYAGRTIGVPANGSIAPIAFGPGTAVAVRRALRTLEPDVIHVHEPLIPSTSLLALWNATAPLVGTFHAAAPSSTAYRLSRPVLNRAARRLAVRTAVSIAARDLAAAYFPGDFRITPNGVDFERYASAPAVRNAGDPMTVLFLSRLEKRKGLGVLIRAVARLSDVAVRLVVAGDGPERGAAEALARQQGVDAVFLGRIDEVDLPSLYRNATVYCAPGLGGESFGIVLIEAMAAGAPLVCSDLPGFRDVAGGAGLLVPPDNERALADALRDVLQDEELRRSMSERSSERARLFDWGRLVRDVEKLYDEARGAP
ncbi:MAG TPA: glycosyltransferase family 4 protein [Actinomycetota bacterium]|nr:glycosyltransferase family 4 protein [Actinomycetota bacterium]